MGRDPRSTSRDGGFPSWGRPAVKGWEAAQPASTKWDGGASHKMKAPGAREREGTTPESPQPGRSGLLVSWSREQLTSRTAGADARPGAATAEDQAVPVPQPGLFLSVPAQSSAVPAILCPGALGSKVQALSRPVSGQDPAGEESRPPRPGSRSPAGSATGKRAPGRPMLGRGRGGR